MSQQIMKRVVYEIDGEDIAMDVEGPFSFGDDYVMLSEDMDLTAGLPWHEPGYTVAPFLDDAAFARFWGSVSGVLQDALAACGLTVDGPIDWSRYHALPGLTPQIHRDFIEVIRKPFHMAEYADRVDLWPVVERVSQICNATLMTDRFNIRVVRPRSGDNNPPHRDVWLDHLRHLINIYAPLAGSNARSSLPIAPGSHLWSEADIERTPGTAQADGITYGVPSVTGTRRGNLRMVRPNPGPGEVLVFSPYTIHGGAKNLNDDLTRVSLEMRFARMMD